jgi:hypothetical protein
MKIPDYILQALCRDADNRKLEMDNANREASFSAGYREGVREALQAFKECTRANTSQLTGQTVYLLDREALRDAAEKLFNLKDKP